MLVLNEDTRSHWLGRDNVGDATIEGKQMPVLLDMGANINMISLECVVALGLKMGPLTDLHEGGITIDQPFNYKGRPIGYVIMSVKIDGISNYNEDQVVLMAHSSTEFAHRVPIILGTPTMDWVIMMLKESKTDRLATPWAATTQVAAVRANIATKPVDVMGYEEPVCLLTVEVVKPFETLVVKARTKITFTARHLCCSTLAMDSMDGTLPPGLIVTGAYTVMKRGSKTVSIVLRNTMGLPIHLRKGQKVARVQAANEVPRPHLKPGTLESLEASENPKTSLSVKEHKEKLMATLDLSGLDQWSEEKVEHACKLLMEYHDIFSLDDNELGCASQVKHNIKVTDDEPFKEQF